MDNLSMQTRVMIAAILSFGFFILFDTYYVQDIRKQQKKEQIEKKINTENQAPSMAESSLVAPEDDESIDLSVSIENDKNIISTIYSKDFNVYIDDKGRIGNVKLKGDKFGQDGLNMFSDDVVKPLEIRFSDKAINQEAFNTKYTSKKKTHNLDNKTIITLTQKLKDLTITKYITFFPNGSYLFKVVTSKDVKMFVTLGYRPSGEVDGFVFNGAIVKEFDNTLSLYEDGDVVSNTNFSKASIVSSSDKYYVHLLYDMDNNLKGVVSKYKDDDPLLFVNILNKQTLNGYVGEKNFKKLQDIDPALTDIVEYGFITFFAKPLFAFLIYINSYFDNWGWSIIILTIIIKILVFPLTYKGMMSMGRLKELTPQVKELQAKHKGDPAKSGAAMMALYKKHNASPMGGCLPILLQIPVFFAIYRVLLNAVELKGAEWTLWINDLSLHDPYFVLPILMGGSMFVQQLITPTTVTDPTQQKIFKFLPVVFTIFFLTFPAGLVLYWIVNNVLSIVQQYYINKKLEWKRMEKESHQK